MKHILIRLTLIPTLLGGLATVSVAAELPRAEPASVGVSAERLEFVGAAARQFVDAGYAPGIVTMISRDGKIIDERVAGTFGTGNDTPMTADALFRIYSMTKAITGVAALILYEEGHFHLSTPVAEFLPEFADMQVFEDGKLRPATRPMTMHHLLTHMAGLGYGFPPDHPVYQLVEDPKVSESPDLRSFARRVASLPLVYEPGTDWQYSYASDVLGAVVEVIAGQPLADFMAERIFEPLDMVDTTFEVDAAAAGRLVDLHAWNAESGQLVTVAKPPYPATYRVAPYDAGGAGLFSTARDYLRFLEMLRRGGSLDGHRVLGPKTVRYMMTDHLPRRISDANIGPDHDPMLGLGAGHGLGIGVYIDPVRRGVLSSAGEVDWGGAAGTLYWLDPVEDVIVVAMIQVFRAPGRLRDTLSVAIYQALTEVREGS